MVTLSQAALYKMRCPPSHSQHLSMVGESAAKACCSRPMLQTHTPGWLTRFWPCALQAG